MTLVRRSRRGRKCACNVVVNPCEMLIITTLEGRAPLVFQDIQADATDAINVRMIDFSQEMHLGRNHLHEYIHYSMIRVRKRPLYRKKSQFGHKKRRKEVFGRAGQLFAHATAQRLTNCAHSFN